MSFRDRAWLLRHRRAEDRLCLGVLVLLAVYVLAPVLLSCTARAAPPEPGTADAETMAPHREWITRQRAPSGALCCSESDGRPIEPGELRHTPAGYQVLYSRAHWDDAPEQPVWLPVPAAAVLPQLSPMVQPVAWIMRGRVLCLALSGAM